MKFNDIKGTLCLRNPFFIKFFRNVKHMFNNVLIMDLVHVRCLTAEESSAECAVMCRKGSKM
jgi:hypothetical protein